MDRLSLAYEDLAEIPDNVIKRYGQLIIDLDLSHNKITDLRFLLNMPQLESLILDHNGIQDHVKIPNMDKLHTLWLNHNKVHNLGLFVTNLAKSCPKLKYLSMMNNEAAPSYFNGGTYMQYQDYRYFVISKFPTMQMLDDRQVSKEERQAAERIYIHSLKDESARRNRRRESTNKKKAKKSSDNTPEKKDPEVPDLSSLLQSSTHIEHPQNESLIHPGLPNFPEVTKENVTEENNPGNKPPLIKQPSNVELPKTNTEDGQNGTTHIDKKQVKETLDSESSDGFSTDSSQSELPAVSSLLASANFNK